MTGFPIAILLAAALAFAAPAAPAAEPSIGQGGKDVIWLPTELAVVEKMLDLAEVTKNDFVVDLGSGDGRTVVAAAKRGARALGIEYDAGLVALSRKNAAGTQAQFIQGDIFQSDFSQATVVTLFLLSTLNEKLRPKLLAMRPGTRVVSNTFRMGDWEPDAEGSVPGCGSFCTALLWIVPAKVDGYWRSGDTEIALVQTYQKLKGMVKNGGSSAAIPEARLRGDRIELAIGAAHYRGVVKGNIIEGEVLEAGRIRPWKAVRAPL
jgi:SAM-dependent methyltransferase